MSGYIRVYTGKGKGKTTSAIGLAVKAAGAGKKVLFLQFIKGDYYSEIKALERLGENISVEQYGLGRFFGDNPDPEDIEIARRGLERARLAVASGDYDMIVLDEANVAVKSKLFSVEELLEVISLGSSELELVITGRYVSPRVIDKADVVFEMNEVKHYFRKGIPARVGIEK